MLHWGIYSFISNIAKDSYLCTIFISMDKYKNTEWIHSVYLEQFFMYQVLENNIMDKLESLTSNI